MIILLMVNPSSSQSGSQQIHSRIELVINWSVFQIKSNFVVLRIIANVEIWNEASTNQNLIFPLDCSSKLEANIILVNSTLYDGISSECREQINVIEYTPGLTTDTFSIDIIFNDPELRNLPDGSYDIWLPVNGGNSLIAQILMVEGSFTITYQNLLDGWGANDNRPIPTLIKQSAQQEVTADDGVNTLTSTLVVGDAIQYSFGIGVVVLIVSVIIIIRKNYRD